MDEVLLCNVRSPDRLFGLVNYRSGGYRSPAPGESLSSDYEPYQVEKRPLSPDSIEGCQKTLLSSWERLRTVLRPSEQTLADILQVLLGALPDPELPGCATLPSLTPFFDQAPVSPCPKKSKQCTTERSARSRNAPVFDLRPYLCSASHTHQLLLHLSRHLSGARRILKESGMPLKRLSQLVDPSSRLVDPHMREHYRTDQPLHSLPLPFRYSILPGFKDRPWEEVGRALALYWGLELERSPNLLHALSRLFMLHRPRTALGWGEHLYDLAPERRLFFLEALLQNQRELKPLTHRGREILLEAEQLCESSVYRHRMDALFRQWRSGADQLDYLFLGFELANAVSPQYRFVRRTDRLYDSEAVRRFREQLETDSVSHAELRVWSICSRWSGFQDLFTHSQWLQLPHSDRTELMELYLGVYYLDVPWDDLKEVWGYFISQLDALLEKLQAIPQVAHSFCFDLLRDLFDECPRLEEAKDGWRRALDLLAPVVSAGGLTSNTLVYPVFCKLNEDNWQNFLKAPQESFVRLNKEMARENDTVLLQKGGRALVARSGSQFVEGFCHCPTLVLKAMKVLGGAGSSIQREVIDEWLAHPLTQLSAESLSTLELVKTVLEQRPDAILNPVPKKLRLWVEGEHRLTQGQIQRGRDAILEGLVRLRWDLLHYLVLERLATGLASMCSTPRAQHALRLYGLSEENRRGLRRFLKAYFSGDETCHLDHPVNQQWLTDHPRICRDSWLQGVEHCASHSAVGAVVLSIEQDPLEVLRMGTYVGSCLGLGGCNSDSAVAVALDINKQVVYARNQEGTIFARQLVAISEQDQLLCYPVYTTESSSHWEAIFREYDFRLADLLGITIYIPQEDDEGVAPEKLVSRFWYDDGAWNLEVDSG